MKTLTSNTAISNKSNLVMKAITTLFVSLFATITLSASEPITILTNDKIVPVGKVLERTIISNDTSTPLRKYVYVYGAEGKLDRKTTYCWKNGKGWVGKLDQVLCYNTEDLNQLDTVANTQWDDKASRWSSETLVDSYTNSANFLSAIDTTLDK